MPTMEPQKIEASIAALESELGISITIVDNQGVFCLSAGKRIFNLSRKSHRKSRVCEEGFSEYCIQHCRHEMNARSEATREIFIETCWKGVTEIVVPLNNCGRHLGMLYAGAWRKKKTKPAKEMSQKFKAEFMRLPIYNQARINKICTILQLFARGLLAELEDCRAVGVPEDSRAGQIHQFFRDNALKPVQLEDLCNSLNLSRSRTSFLLNNLFGKAFLTMLSEERVNQAKIMLLSCDDTLAMISRKVGFNNEYHFSRNFKKITGFAPGKFRKVSENNEPYGNCVAPG